MMGPIMPHIAEEARCALGLTSYLHMTPWPQVETDILYEETATFSIQINGKHRGTICAPKTVAQDTLCDLIRQNPRLQTYVHEKWDRIIFVPGRMINIVIKSI